MRGESVEASIFRGNAGVQSSQLKGLVLKRIDAISWNLDGHCMKGSQMMRPVHLGAMQYKAR